MFGLYIVLWGKGEEFKRAAHSKLTKGSLEVEPLEIVTTNHAEGNSVKNDGNSMDTDITTQSSFLTENDHLSRKGPEDMKEKKFQFTNKDSKPG